MQKNTFARLTSLGGVLTVAALTVAYAAPAHAESIGNSTVRVIDQTKKLMPVDHVAVRTLQARFDSSSPSTIARMADSAPSTVKSAEEVPLPAGVSLEPGQTVQVNYADGTATHTAITAACTSTSTAENPYKDGGYAWSYHSHRLSAGCGSSTSVNGLLQTPGFLGWNNQNFTTVTVDPNSTLYWATNKKCKASSSTKWRGINTIGSSTTAQSADKTLACSV